VSYTIRTDSPDNDKVICPNCVHQFVAVPVNVQKELVQYKTRLKEEMVRDGDWIDKWGSCRTCGGEIPYGHTDTCYLYKLECELAEAKEQIEQLRIRLRQKYLFGDG
jgi:hypothetical protein